MMDLNVTIRLFTSSTKPLAIKQHSTRELGTRTRKVDESLVNTVLQ
jgi:hypothetical protein